LLLRATRELGVVLYHKHLDAHVVKDVYWTTADGDETNIRSSNVGQQTASNRAQYPSVAEILGTMLRKPENSLGSTYLPGGQQLQRFPYVQRHRVCRSIRTTVRCQLRISRVLRTAVCRSLSSVL